MKFQTARIHGSKDMRGLKSMTYGQTDKLKAICSPNFFEVEGKLGSQLL